MIPILLRRPFIWLLRFRHRRGYGVHSPFAFQLITEVINERWPYYDYADLLDQEESFKAAHDKHLQAAGETLKLRRLLYRLANYVHPQNIIFVGKESMSFNYMKMSCRKANYLISEGRKIPKFDGSYLAYVRTGFSTQQLKDICLPLIDSATSESLLIIQGIGYSKDAKCFWKSIKDSSQIGITFDLYDVGLIFFDHSRIKQHYIVNF